MTFEDAIYFDSPEAFGAWLAEHHATQTEVFVGYFKKHTGKQVMSWPQAVDEALCWGWIDGVMRRIDDERSAQRFTPRKQRSHWSKVNVAKYEALEQAGRMREPGRAAFARRTEENTGQASFEREALALSDDYAARLAAVPDAAAWFAEQAPWYRRGAADWVMRAKREDTRERRIAQLIECSSEGRTIPPLTRPS